MADAKSAAPAVGSATNQAVGENLAQALLQVNKLLYKTPPSLSVATTRRMISAYPQQRTYGNGETFVMSFPTGSQFIDFKNSYLKLRVSFAGATPVGSWGSGSVANLITEVRVKSRSGTNLCRLQGFNAYTAMAQRWQHSNGDFESVMQAQGYGNRQLSATGSVGVADASIVLRTGADFVLPLDTIPCFDPLGGVLIPPQMLDGAIIEMDLETPAAAFMSSTSSVTSYTISSLELRLCAFTLGDAFQRKISQISASQGLSISFYEKYRTLVSSDQASFQYDVKKSASQAVAVYMLPRPTASLTAGSADTMASEPLECKYLQVNVGPVYFPNAPLQITSVPDFTNASEMYRYTIQAWKTGRDKDVGVPFQQYVAADANGFYALMGTQAVSFVRSSVSNASGIMINSSRSAIIDIQFQTGTGAGRRIDTWLCYVRNVKVYLSNQVVSD
jgi:hypothetical protein